VLPLLPLKAMMASPPLAAQEKTPIVNVDRR